MIESQNRIRLGELLVDAGVVSSADLTEAIQVSTRLNIPIGRVLLLSGLVSPVTLEAALESQPLLNEEKESRQNVIKALKEVDTTGKSLNKLLPSTGYGRAGEGSLGKDKLADLLLDSEIVSQDQLDQALSTSFEAGVPLGSALVLEGILSPSLFPSILQIQQRVRSGELSEDEAIEEVKSTFVHWLKAEESLSSKQLGVDQARKETGSQSSPKPKVSQEIDKALSKNPENSTETIDTTSLEDKEQHISITFEPTSFENNRLVDLLKEAGKFDDMDIENAFNKVLDNPQKSAEVFELLGLIDPESKKKAIKCHNLLKRGQLSRKEAWYVLDSNLSKSLEPNQSRIEIDSNNIEENSPEDKKIKAYFDKDYRKSLFSKVVGGMVVGAAVAGFSIFKNRGK